MGFGYDALRQINPRVIMVSSCLLGQTGPFSGYAGYGNLAAAVSGFHRLTGFPGDAPTGCFGPYTDFLAVRFNALALLQAIDHQRRTGEGQYIDMAQAEASLNFLGAECARYFATGKVNHANGNRDSRFVPQGVFRVRGEDRWIALSVRSDEEWSKLCELSGHSGLSGLQSWSQAERRAAEASLEVALAAWLADEDGLTVERLLQEEGIPAHRVLDTHDLFEDPQLDFRGHFIPVHHHRHANAHVESTRILMSRTRARTPEVAPWFGVDNQTVLNGILGYDEERIAALDRAGALK
jgi:benzylsuccinate CoA-transferase BbsF subunit